MKTILIVSCSKVIHRQITNRLIQSDYEFHFNDFSRVYDYALVLDNIDEEQVIQCSKENIFLSICEPPQVYMYENDFLDQFGVILTCHRKMLNLKKSVLCRPLLPWLVGVRYDLKLKEWDNLNFRNFEQLKHRITGKRKNKFVAILSKKNIFKGHKIRTNLLRSIQRKRPDLLDLYGHGFLPIEDKFDILKEYKYTLAFENCSYPYYWTEKISDAFISECYPFYFGCKEINLYFDEKSFLHLSNNDMIVTRLIELMDKCIKEDFYTAHIDSILLSKEKCLGKYNLLEDFITIIEQRAHSKQIIRPKSKSTIGLIKQKIIRCFPIFNKFI